MPKFEEKPGFLERSRDGGTPKNPSQTHQLASNQKPSQMLLDHSSDQVRNDNQTLSYTEKGQNSGQIGNGGSNCNTLSINKFNLLQSGEEDDRVEMDFLNDIKESSDFEDILVNLASKDKPISMASLDLDFPKRIKLPNPKSKLDF